MPLPLVINPGDLGHITHHEEIHAFLEPIDSPFTIAQDAGDVLANRPAAGEEGRYYLATDTGVLYRDSGSSWQPVHNMLTTWEASLLSSGNNLTKLIKPACIATKGVAQSIANATSTALTFPSEDYDNDGMHSVSSNTSRITINRAGLYIVGAVVGWDSFGSGTTLEVRATSFRVNATTTYGGPRADVGASQSFFPSVEAHNMIPLAAGDYVEVMVLQNTSPAQSADVLSARFWAVMVSST